MQRTCPYEMPPGYTRLREERPLSRVALYDGRQVWLVSGYTEGRDLLLDPRLSSDTLHPGFPYLTERQAAQQRAQHIELPLVGLDNPGHARQRRRVASSFGIRRVAALRPEIERLARELTDVMLAGSHQAELVGAYTLPLTFAATFALLGIPQEDRRILEERSRCMLSPAGGDDGTSPEEAFFEIRDYLTGLIAERERKPAEGLIDDLIAHRAADASIGHDELAMTCVVLLGGSESTSTTLASAVLVLLEHPEQLHQMRAEPTLTAAAVDELTRLVSVADGLPRVALADIPFAGQIIEEGDGVIVSTMLMNRDPGVWADPDTLDIHRAAGRHVAFGYGIHQCVGQNLARAEMEIALTTLLRRIPTLRLAVPVQRVPGHTPYVQQGGVAELPVAW
jgi:pentalenic acid synthase